MSKKFKPTAAKQQPKVLKMMVGMPAGDQMYTLTTQSLVNTAINISPETTMYHFAVGSLVYDARNLISDAAIREGADLLLWVDSDMVFAPEDVERLIQTMKETGADLVSGIYTTRKEPIEPVLFKELDWQADKEAGKAMVKREVYFDYPRDSVFEIGGCGFGFVLTKVSTLRKVWEQEGQPFAPLPAMGEDLSCCVRIKRVGGKMLCDSRAKVRHLGVFEVGEAFLDEPEEQDEG